MGWCGSMSHGFVRGERIRHVAWRAAEDPTGAKQGLCTAIACTLSLFSGLYGSFAMQLSDLIAQRTPVLSLLNPAQQITNLFYDILLLRQFQTVSSPPPASLRDEPGLPCCGDRSVEEATL